MENPTFQDIPLHINDTRKKAVTNIRVFVHYLKDNLPNFIQKHEKRLVFVGGFTLGLVLCSLLVLSAWWSHQEDALLHSLKKKKVDFKPSPVLSVREVPPGPRILCVIGTYPSNFRSKDPHVVATWTSRCDSVVFITPAPTKEYRDDGYLTEKSWQEKKDLEYLWEVIRGDMRYNILEVAGTAARNDLYLRLKDGLIKIWHLYGDTFDFIFKCDDDTYVIMENLKKRLSQLDPNKRILLGAAFFDQNTKYLSGGAGTAISKAGVKAIVEEGLGSNSVPCELPVQTEQQIKWQIDDDIQLGECAKILNFQIYSSEYDGKMTFFPFPLEQHLVASLTENWWIQHSLECRETPSHQCPSNYPITFHYVSPQEMYKLEYLLYVARVFNEELFH